MNKPHIPLKIKQLWQRIVDDLAELFDVPAALIMRNTDPYIEVFQSSGNEQNPYTPGQKEKLKGSGLYCEHVIRKRQGLMVSDASADPDWKDNPDMKLGMKAYLGYPVEWPDGEIFGTICVLDRKSRDFSDRRVRILEEFRSLVQAHLELLYKNTQLDEKIRELNELNTLYIKREERILKLKKEVNDLLVSSGKPIRYKSV